jgi:transcription elongation factor SPT5
MSKKFFRPPPQQFGDDDDSDDDDDSEEEDEDDHDHRSSKLTSNRNGKSIRTSTNANLSDDEDDDDDDDDEEEEEEEEKNLKRKHGGTSDPSRKKSKAASFFDMEAEASDDDDDDEYEAGGKDSEQMDEEARELIRQQDRRRAASGRFGDRSVAEITREIESRHRMQRRTVDRSVLLDRAVPETAPIARERTAGTNISVVAEAEVGYTAAVAQQSLVPSVSDPSFWMVSCLNGKEQELVFQIMNKCTALARQGRPLGISAVIAAQSKGKIYVESFSEPAVIEAIKGVRGLLQYTMRLVPIGDMTTVMTVVSKKKPVKKNDWVRMTRSHYKGDLALVKQVKESGLKCIVQCVPRLDLTLADLPAEEARTRRRTIRPPMKFFNPQEVTALGRQTLRRQRYPGLDIYCDYFEGNYYNDGYLLKEMTVGSMVKPCTEDDPPTLEELQSFQRRKKYDGNDNDVEVDNEGSKIAASLLDELSALQGTVKSTGGASHGLMIGDTVEIVEGDLVGMRGKLVSIDGSTVKIQPTNTTVDLGGTNEVEFLSNQVRKYIPVGAHVKVTEGRYANETGVVVAVDSIDGETDCTAVVLTDVTNKEISLRTSQLRESAEVASGQDKLSGYELYDLVVLSGGGSANEVGVIVRVGREDFTVVNNHGIAREVRPEELRGKRNSTSSRAVALDVQGNQIRVGDSVNIAEGPHKGKTATIKRMSRAQLFLHSQTRSDHAGIFVVRSRSCILAGSRSQNRAAGAAGSSGSIPSGQTNASSGGAGARGKKDDGLIGKTVRVQAGQWKGYIGTVSDSTATHVQVELHSRLKKVLVVRERVLVIGDKFGATEQQSQSDGPVSVPGPMTMATPMIALGGATPAIHGFGGATPAHETDEVWRPGGSIDQDSIKADDGWGSSANDNNDTTTNDENDDGWGSNSGIASTWGAPVPKKEEESNPSRPAAQEGFRAPVAVKREQTTTIEADGVDMDDAPIWFMERVCIQLKENGMQGIIKEINPDKSAVVEFDDKSTKTVRFAELSMVAPAEQDTVLVTGGNEIGLEGSLVCVDGMFILHMFWISVLNNIFHTYILCNLSITGSDAILKDANEEFKIIDFVHLVKILAES